MLTWLKNKYEDWKLERAFQARKKELMKIDPFIYDLPNSPQNKIDNNDNQKN
mgnify:FL=1